MLRHLCRSSGASSLTGAVGPALIGAVVAVVLHGKGEVVHAIVADLQTPAGVEILQLECPAGGTQVGPRRHRYRNLLPRLAGTTVAPSGENLAEVSGGE